MPVKLSVIIPAYNEEQRLGPTLERVASYLEQTRPGEWELVVVNDGSKDGTAKLVEQAREKYPQIRLITNNPNRGKGYSVRAGVMEAAGELVLFSDADLSSPIEELEKLAPFFERNYDVAIGSRDIIGSQIDKAQPLHRRIMGYTFMVLRDWIAVTGFRDTQCGFKMFRKLAAREVFSRSLIQGFCFDVEILAIAKSLGYKMCEVPVIWRNDERSTVDPIRDSTRMFMDLFRIRWNILRGNYGRSLPPSTPGT